MSVEAVRRFLAEHGLADAYRSFETSSATVELAAAALGCEPGRIAKSKQSKEKERKRNLNKTCIL